LFESAAIEEERDLADPGRTSVDPDLLFDADPGRTSVIAGGMQRSESMGESFLLSATGGDSTGLAFSGVAWSS